MNRPNIKLTIFFQILVCWTINLTKSSIEPSYKVIENLLHERIEQIFNNDDDNFRHIKAPTGRLFKYDLANDASDIYEVVESGTYTLPKWLEYEHKKKRLIGVPTDSDLTTGLKIEFHTKTNDELNGITQSSKYIIIDVERPQADPLTCMNADGVTTASIIYHAELAEFSGAQRGKLMKRLARAFNKGKKEFILEPGNKMENDHMFGRMRMAGPGDREDDIKGEKTGFTVSFVVECNTDFAGNPDVMQLKSFSQREKFESISVSDVKVLGWYVSVSRTNRARRAVGVGGTPGLTPSILVVGTPVLDSSPIVPIESTDMAKPTPSKSIEAIVKPTAPPPVTTATTSPSTKTESTEEFTTTTSAFTTAMTTEQTASTESTRKPNVGPEKIGKIDDIHVFENQGILHPIPSNLFFDENNDPLNISLKRYLDETKKVEDVPAGFWMEYSNKGLYMFPQDKDIGAHIFSVVATDPSGENTSAMFTVHVRSDDIALYNNRFNVTIAGDYATINNSVKKKVKLLQSLAMAMKLRDSSEVRAVEFLPGSIIIRWGLAEFKNKGCNEPEIAQYQAKLTSSEFKNDFFPYEVLSSGYEPKECEDLSPVSDRSSDLLQRTLIPVIIVVVVVIIIILVLCCVCRRKRNYKKAPSTEDDGVYLSHKKPIIFQEEYDEKTSFVSLSPTTLPHEKPPVSNNYNESDGPGSSTTVSTESDEKALLYPSSPKDSRQTFNSPPPYGA